MDGGRYALPSYYFIWDGFPIGFCRADSETASPLFFARESLLEHVRDRIVKFTDGFFILSDVCRFDAYDTMPIG